MSYQIARNGEDIGTFTEEEVLEGVESGHILPSDHLWTEGMEDWVLVETLIEEEEVESAEDTGVDPMDAPPSDSEEETPPSSQGEETAADLPPTMPMKRELPSAPVRRVAKVVVPAVSAELKASSPPPAPPRVVRVAPAPRSVPQERVVMMPMQPSIMPGQYGVAGEATASMVFGILSLLCLCFTAVPAIIYGHMALGRIRRTGRAYSGEGLAIAGLVLGYFFLVVSIGIAVAYGTISPIIQKVFEEAAAKRG